MGEIIYVSKDQLHPRFGYAVVSKQIAYVRDDLPKCVKEFVKASVVKRLVEVIKGPADK